MARLPLPGTGRVAWVPVAAVGILGALLIATAETYADAFITTLGMGIIVASVVVVSGYAGQLSLCQLALAGFGAWTAARSANSFDLGFVPAILIGVAAAVAVGVVVALPAIRTRGVTLAVATLALALVFSALIFQNPSMTGGFEGIVVDSHRIAGVDFDPLAYPQRYAGLLLVALIVVSLLVANLRRGATGRRMIAVRSNERAASALGIGVIGVKLYAFAVGSGIAAFGGILLAFRQHERPVPDLRRLRLDPARRVRGPRRPGLDIRRSRGRDGSSWWRRLASPHQRPARPRQRRGVARHRQWRRRHPSAPAGSRRNGVHRVEGDESVAPAEAAGARRSHRPV